MFRRFMVVVAAMLVISCFSGCSVTKRDLVDVVYNTEVPPKMIFLGDSIAAGYGLEGYTSDNNYNCPSYSNILKEKYTAELSDICQHEMQNFAVSGADSADLLGLLNSGKLDSALENADAVVVSIGGNDLLHIILDDIDSIGITLKDGKPDFDDIDLFSAATALLSLDSDIDEALEGFENNLRLISDSLNTKTDGVIYIQTLYDPLETFTKIAVVTEFSKEKIGRFNDILRENAEGNYTIIDVAAKFENKCESLTRIGELDIHPNEEGHQVIAETVDAAFRATGFTYIKQEYGEPHLTITAVLLIIGGIAATFIVVMLVIPQMFKKYREE